MSDALLQFIIVIALGGFCFGCGCLTAFIVTRTRFRDQMIKRGAARYDSETGKAAEIEVIKKKPPIEAAFAS